MYSVRFLPLAIISSLFLTDALQSDLNEMLPSGQTELSLEVAAYANPASYVPVFYNVLRYFEAKVYAREPVPKTHVTKSYVKRKIDKILDTRDISGRNKSKLCDRVRKAVNKNESISWTPVLLRCIGTQRPAVEAMIAKCRNKIDTGTFRPKTFTDPKGCRRYTLCPILSFRQRHLPIDYQVLCSLAKIKVMHDTQPFYWLELRILTISSENSISQYG